MANLRETATWESGIYQLETTDPVVGGVDGISNKQAIQLANRTGYLKSEVEALKSDASAKLASKRDVSDSYSKGEINALLAPKLDAVAAEATYMKKTDKIDAYTKAQSDEKYALKTELKDGIPTGSYLLYSSNANIPNGFLRCDGSALDKNAYAALFAAIGYTYGRSGDKFLLPNFSDGKFLRSVGGKAAALGTAQEGAILDHHHIHPSTNGLGIGNVGGDIRSFGSARSGTSSTSFEYMRVQGASTADENRPYNTAVVVLIKY